MTAATKTRAAQNGQPDPMLEALTYEQAIADEAAEIRGDATELTPELFMQLWPLLKRPIPAGLIQTVPPTKGKPYASTGIRSVQVQIDRMNNVLTPMWWDDAVEYSDGGKLAKVTVSVLVAESLFSRSSMGGVAQGSGAGNIYKGSYTNAAKLAFARIGPGHEVYLGAADLDPDTNQEAAEQQTAPAGTPNPASFGALPAERIESLGKAIRTLGLSDSRIALMFGTVGADAPGEPSDNGSLRIALGALTDKQAGEIEAELEREAESDV